MSPLLQSLVLGGFIGAADYRSTQVGLSRGGVESSMLGPKAAPIAFGALVAGGDLLVQKQAPKGKWVYRGLVIVGTGLLVRNNIRDHRNRTR